MPLDSESRATLAGAFARNHGGLTLYKVQVQDKLVARCAGEGVSFHELPWAVDANDKEGWKDEWRGLAKEAGIEDASYIARLLRWLEKREAGSAAADPTRGAATAARLRRWRARA